MTQLKKVPTLLSALTPVEPDTILSISALYLDDTRAEKIDLGVGVYRDEKGVTPLMQAVSLAMKQLSDEQKTKVYVGLAGNQSFNQSILRLLFASETLFPNTQSNDQVNTAGRRALEHSVALQTPGGSGALRLIAELIAKAKPNATVWMSDPSYANHQPIMSAAGLSVKFYPYFDYQTKGIDESAMLSCFEELGRDDILLLHGCCHNPTGTELSFEQWKKITELALKRGFIPFIDMAYQGLSQDWETDGKGVRWLADRVPEVFLSLSCSKNFGLYRERTGAAVILSEDSKNRTLAYEHLFKIARTTYTMPPDHGAAIVDKILNDPKLYSLWQEELTHMASRLRVLRSGLVDAFNHYNAQGRFDFITKHCGMFSILGLTEAQVITLREQHAIYMVNDSRVNIASLNHNQLDYLARSIMSLFNE